MCSTRNEATATEGETPLAFAADSTTSGTAELRMAFPELRPWSPEDPHLYRVEVTLLDATGARDGTTVRTGFRTLVTDTNTGNFLLNGRPLFLRGCGYDSLEPLYGSPPPDKAVYVERSAPFEELRLQRHSVLGAHAAARVLRGCG